MLRRSKGDPCFRKNNFRLLNAVFQQGFAETFFMQILVHHAPAHDHMRHSRVLGWLVDTDASAADDHILIEDNPVGALRIDVLIEKGIKERKLFLRKIHRHITPEDLQEPFLMFGQIWLNGYHRSLLVL